VVKCVFTLRQGGMKDLDAVFRLNRKVFAENWSYQSLYSALSSGYDLLLCESDEGLAGYLLSLSVHDEVQIMQIAVAVPFRQQGLANRMTRHLIGEKSHIAEISLEVRETNRIARQLYAGLGFVERGRRKNYYSPDASGRREDAIIMARRLQ
jgi:ribosomal-protein-alanine N-acetyltransferase